MGRLFDYDNPVWRFIGKFFDVMVLNVLWFICSIPIVTIGASTTAVYYVTLKMVRDEEGSTIKSFFKSFRENFRQATAIWLILLVVGAVIGFDLYFFGVQMQEGTLRMILLSLLCGFGLIEMAVFLYVFPLQCRFYNPVKKTLSNALLISIRHLPRTICLLIIDGALPILALLVPVLQPIMVLFGFALIAFINSYMLAGVIEKYMPERKEAGERDEEFQWE